MKRGRKNDKKDDKQQSSLFGTFLPLKQKFKETGETLCDIDFSQELKSELNNYDLIESNDDDYELLEKKYFVGINLQGQEQAKQKIHDWYTTQNWKNKPLLLSGKSGVGKTCLIKGYFKQFSIWDESFLQEGEILSVVLKELLERKPLFGIKRCVFLDCLDGFTKSELNEITKLLKRKEFFFPLIFTCDDEFDIPKELKSQCIQIKLDGIKIQTFKSIIENILKGENLKLHNDVLENLYESCFGNVRFAINELQFLLQTRKRKLLSKESSLCTKDVKFDLFESTQKLFLGIPLTLNFLQTTKGEINMMGKIIHENSFHLFPLQKHWECLSLSDILEYKNEELATLILYLSTIINSRQAKLNLNQTRFPSPYFTFETTKARNEQKMKKSKESYETFFKIPCQKT